MSLTLHVEGDRWRAHLRDTLARHPGLVPVTKGNGYGLGLHRLARRAQWLGVDTVAVGTYPELAELHQRFDGSLLVLSPWRPGAPHDLATPGVDPDRVVHSVGRLADLDALCPGGLQAPADGSLDVSLVDPDTGQLRATVTRAPVTRASGGVHAGSVSVPGPRQARLSCAA